MTNMYLPDWLEAIYTELKEINKELKKLNKDYALDPKEPKKRNTKTKERN